MREDKTPTQDSEWVSFVDEKVRQGEDWTTKKQMLVNTNYYVGNQWITWNEATRRVMPYPNYNNEERITHNVLKPRVMTKLAKQTKNRIKYDVVPDTNDQGRIEIAKAASKFLKFWWEEEEMDRKTRDIFLFNGVKGFCAAKVYFDPEEGEEVGEQDGRTLRMGKIKCRVCDPLTLYIDPAATSDDEIRWWVEEKPRDLDYIEAMYGKKVTPDENIDYITGNDLLVNSTGMAVNTRQKVKNMAMVRECWVKPCKKYPNGLKVTTTRTEFLEVNENAGDLPYILFGDIPIPGSVKYDAFIKDMLPIQRKINIVQSRMATHLKKMGNSVWTVPLGSLIEGDEGGGEEQLTDEESAIIYYNGQTGKPERVPPNDLPSFFDRIMEYSMRDIDDMSGAREIAQGRLPAGLDTASGLALMVEQENEKLAVSSQNYERGMKRLLKRVLVLMKKHYTEERLGRILGDNNEIELIAFTGADLTGGEDINIIQGSSLPEMRSAQEDRIVTMWDKGAIVKKDGSPDHSTFLRLMGMGDSTELFEQHQLDENNAKMENKQFTQIVESPEMMQALSDYLKQVDAVNQVAASQGLPPDALKSEMPPLPQGLPEVWDSDDDEVHLYIHNLFRKTSEYRQLPPEIRMAVDLHYQQHLERLQAPQKAAEQQQMQMAEQQQQVQSAEADKAFERNVMMQQQKHQQDLEKELVKAQVSGRG